MKVAPPALRWLWLAASRYTRTVSWRHRISLVLLIVLTAVPVSGTVCAMLCDSAAATRAAAHHGSGKPCDDEQATTPSSGPQVRGAAGHDCGDHDAAVRVSGDDNGRPAPMACRRRVCLLPYRFTTPSAVSPTLTPHSTTALHLGSTPPTASPLVLRV